MSITKHLLLNWYSSMKKNFWNIRIIFDVANWLWKSEFCNFQQLLCKFTQDLKKILGSSLTFTLKEGPVRCAKVCNKSWVILSCFCQLSSFPFKKWENRLLACFIDTARIFHGNDMQIFTQKKSAKKSEWQSANKFALIFFRF